MLNFKPITLEARRDLLPFLGKEHHSACYQSFATMYLWSGIYQTRYCLTGEWHHPAAAGCRGERQGAVVLWTAAHRKGVAGGELPRRIYLHRQP